jgi:hypothetical protein
MSSRSRRSALALAAAALAVSAPAALATLAPGAPTAASAAAAGTPWPPVDYNTGALTNNQIIALTAGGCDFIECACAYAAAA